MGTMNYTFLALSTLNYIFLAIGIIGIIAVIIIKKRQ